jgi:hypothetical protein
MSCFHRALRGLTQAVRRTPFALVVAAGFSVALAAPPSAASQEETPVDLGGGTREEAPVSLEEAPGSVLQIHGFAVADYSYDAETGEDSFDTSAFALSLYRPIFNNRLSFFGQLTVHRPETEIFALEHGGEEGEDPEPGELEGGEHGGGEEGAVETEIDNLLIRWAASPQAGLDLTFGKFDSPLAIERDDAPLNYQATPSFLLDHGRPIKFTGLMVHEAFSPHFEGFAIVANGEELVPDADPGKTSALYGRWSPSLAGHLGLGVIYGDQGAGRNRTTAVGTLLLQPAPSWVVGGEAVSGRQERLEASGSDRWTGATLFLHHRFDHGGRAASYWAATVRGEWFDDADGLQTGAAQTVTSVTVSPQYLLGGGFYGIFHFLEGTSLRLPQLAVRLDLRWDRSDQEVFAGTGEELGRDRYSANLQLVFVF